jgi:hypothetical protein
MVDLTHHDGPFARTAGEEDHSYPFKYAGPDAAAPGNPPATPRLTRAVRRLARKLVPSDDVPRSAVRPWRNCNASMRFVEALNAKYPNRDKASDGTIGDAAHATRASDHNPWVIVGAYGVVRARDVDKDGVDAAWIVEQLRLMGRAGDPRLTGGGYIIFNRRITKPDFSGWSVYTGSNPHDKHFHVSFSKNTAGFDSNATWSFLLSTPAPAPAPAPAPVPSASLPVHATGSRVLSLESPTMRGTDVAKLQSTLNRWYPSLPPLLVDGDLGPATVARIRYFQGKAGLVVDGEVGPATWRKLGF